MTRLQLPFPELSAEMAAEVERVDTEDTLANLDRAQQFADAAAELGRTYDQAVRALCTEEQWATYRRLHKRRLARLRKLRADLDGSVESRDRYNEARRNMIERSVKLFAREGVDTERLRKIQAEHTAAFEKLPWFAVESIVAPKGTGGSRATSRTRGR